MVCRINKNDIKRASSRDKPFKTIIENKLLAQDSFNNLSPAKQIESVNIAYEQELQELAQKEQIWFQYDRERKEILTSFGSVTLSDESEAYYKDNRTLKQRINGRGDLIYVHGMTGPSPTEDFQGAAFFKKGSKRKDGPRFQFEYFPASDSWEFHGTLLKILHHELPPILIWTSPRRKCEIVEKLSPKEGGADTEGKN